MNNAIRYTPDARHPIQVRQAGILLGYVTVCEARRLMQDASFAFRDARTAAAWSGR